MKELSHRLYFEQRSRRIVLLVGAFGFIRFLSLHKHGFTTGPTLCIFKLLTGYPCPVCGTTRAIAAFSEGRLHASFVYNPLGVALVLVSILWALKFPSLEKTVRTALGRFTKTSFRMKVIFTIGINLVMWSWDISRV